MTLTIRSATRSDSPAVRALVDDVLHEFGFALDSHTTDADLQDLEASYSARGGLFEVIVDASGAIVGCAGLYPLHEGSDGSRVGELRKMYLRSAVRGQGLGRQLLDRALAHARASGFRAVMLETASNLTDAIALYRRNGFVEYGADHRTSRCGLTFRLELAEAVVRHEER
jgi:GNAT superfamily N-acetyltransferase